MEFRAETYQNEYLPTGGTAVDAVVTITGTGGGPVGAPGGPAPEAAVVIVLDLSGSMRPRPKLHAARQAAVAAIGSLRDGVHFGVIAGTHEARYLFPAAGLARADAATRAAAVEAVQAAGAEGGTAIGRWLMEARLRLVELPGAIRNVILLTDGKDESETREYLDAVLAQCDGVFQCDCRGIGTDWHVEELRAVASRLLGSVDIIPDPADMAADFAAMTARAMGKRTADVTLRLWTPRHAEVGFVKQVSPTLEDLTDRGVRVDDRTVDYPTGSWGDEERDYHVHLLVPPHEVGEELLAGRVSVVVDGEVATRSMVRAVWTEDRAASTRINPQVAHYTGQAELASAIADGLAAPAAGRPSGRRRSHRHRPPRAGRPAGGAVRPRRHVASAGRRRGHRGGRHRDGAPAARRRRRRRDGPRHPLDPDGAHEERVMAEPGPCPSCGQPRSERDRYCEHCGLDEDTAASWELELGVDRDQFARVGAPGLVWPEARAPAIVPLDGDEVRVGRDRHGEPGVNLDGGWLDPGVSRHHCTFERLHDGGYGVRDAGSTNGTSINADPTPISPFTLVRLDDGDRVHVGAWTVLHYRRVAPGS